MSTKAKKQLEEIAAVLGNNPQGLHRGQISAKLSFSLHNKTLQRRLTDLKNKGLITTEGRTKSNQILPYPFRLRDNNRSRKGLFKGHFL